MKNILSNTSISIVAATALMIFPATLLVAQPTANLYLLDPGSGANLAGIYTSPYDGSINSGASIPIICDDFADESYQSEDWTAFVTSLSSISSESSVNSTVKWARSAFDTNLTQAQAYDAAAILSIDILNGPSGSLTQQLYSYALWALFDPTGTTQDPGAITWLNNQGYGSDVSIVDGYVNTAINDVTNPNATINGRTLSQYLSNYKVTIYSYDSAVNPTCPGGNCPPPPQEFITVTAPEASTPVLLAVDLVGFFALVGISCKRISRSI